MMISMVLVLLRDRRIRLLLLGLMAVAGPLLSYRGDVTEARHQFHARLYREGKVYAEALGLHLQLLRSELTRVSASVGPGLQEERATEDMQDLTSPGAGLFRQGRFALIGAPLLLLAAAAPPRIYRRFATLLLGLGFVLQLLVFVPGLGFEVLGNRNWIRIGSMQLQPSELLKLALAVWLGATLAAKYRELTQPRALLWPVAPVAGLAIGLVVLGHDLGGQLATAYALRYPGDTRAMGYGEAPLPGTEVHDRMKNDPTLFHFAFHTILDLPEALTAGRERWYLQHFYDKLGFRPTAVDTDHFAAAYAEPGAMRAGFDLYRAFEQDAGQFSWWDYRQGAFRRNLGLRIDLILASAALRGRLASASIDRTPRTWERPSDHTPVVLELAN